jgi:hypothetical protein
MLLELVLKIFVIWGLDHESSSSQSVEEIKEKRGLVRACDTGAIITLKEMCSKTCDNSYNRTGRSSQMQ